MLSKIFNFDAVQAKRYMLFGILSIIVMVLPDIAAASVRDSSEATAGLANIICQVIRALQGDFARGVAIIALIFLGFSLFLGKVSWGVALAIGIGLGVVFGAHLVVDFVTANEGGGAELKKCVTDGTAIQEK